MRLCSLRGLACWGCGVGMAGRGSCGVVDGVLGATACLMFWTSWTSSSNLLSVVGVSDHVEGRGRGVHYLPSLAHSLVGLVNNTAQLELGAALAWLARHGARVAFDLDVVSPRRFGHRSMCQSRVPNASRCFVLWLNVRSSCPHLGVPARHTGRVPLDASLGRLGRLLCGRGQQVQRLPGLAAVVHDRMMCCAERGPGRVEDRREGLTVIRGFGK